MVTRRAAESSLSMIWKLSTVSYGMTRHSISRLPV